MAWRQLPGDLGMAHSRAGVFDALGNSLEHLVGRSQAIDGPQHAATLVVHDERLGLRAVHLHAVGDGLGRIVGAFFQLRPLQHAPLQLLGWRVQLQHQVDGGLAIVDFDSHLVYAYRLSKANAMFVRRAVMATLTGLPGISAGLIEIDGSRLLLYTCVNVTQEFPQARPWAINDEFYLTTLSSAG